MEANNMDSIMTSQQQQMMMDPFSFPDDWNQKVLCFNKNTYCLPVSLQLVINRIQNFDIMKGSSNVQFTMYIWINCQGAPQEIITRHNEYVDIRLQSGTIENLNQQNSEISNDENIICITYSGQREAAITGDMKWYPFNLFIQQFEIELMSYVDVINNTECFIRYNFHNSYKTYDMIEVKEFENNLNQCYFAENMCGIDFLSEQHKDYFDQNEKLTYYPKTRYKIALYQSPLEYAISVFLPLMVITVINFICFFEKFDQIYRVCQAILFLIPQFLFYFYIKTVVPKTNYLTLNDMFLASNILCTMLLFIQSVILLNKDLTYTDSQVYQAFQVLAGFILFTPILVFLIKFMLFICIKKKAYEKRQDAGLVSKKFGEFKIGNWYNDFLPYCCNPNKIRFLH